MRRFVLALIFILLSIDPLYGAIRSHDLWVRIDPETHTIEGKDRISLGKEGGITLRLDKGMKVLAISGDGKGATYRTTRKGDWLEVSIKGGYKTLTIHYRGRIHYPIRREKTLTFLRGDVTRGIISSKGVFLAPESGWYPDDGESLATFRLRVEIKGGLKVVTQGESIKREEGDGVEYSEWRVDVPSDGLVLVASRFVIERKREGGITYATYLSKKNAHLSDLFIDASKRYIGFYSRLIGRYPFKEWAVVENFFSSGYGMPGFTLLDPMVVRMGRRIIRPGYIDHEVVHSWFGNFVYPRYEEGNWAEAITTYLTNYYYKEVFSGEEEARRHRIITVERYSIRVPPERDYPLRMFVTKAEEFENDIGYGKGSMVFHYLRRILGDGDFFRGIRTFVRDYGGKRAGWEEMRRVFEEVSGRDLSWFFRQWLDRRRGPLLKIEGLRIRREGRGYRVEGRIRQLGEIYTLPLLPLRITTEKGRKEITVDLTGRDMTFSTHVGGRVLSVEIDPDYHVFRIIPEGDLHPSLNLLLSRKEKTYILLGEGGKRIIPLFERIRAIKGGRTGKALKEAMMKGSVLVAGTRAIIRNPWLKAGDGSFTFMGRVYARPDHSILLSIRNPYRDGEVVTIYYGNSEEAFARAVYLPYYGNDTYVIFEGGRPIERGFIREGESWTAYDLRDISKRRMEDHIRFLASRQMKGRLSGTPEDERVRQYLKEELLSYGLKVYEQEFVVKDGTFKGQDGRVKPPVRTGNVLGVREDREYIILSAHHDHNGMDERGNIYYGADDNASGVAVVLEVARMLSMEGWKGFIILFPGAEEWGLRGSRHFVKNPPIPLEGVRAVINVDTVGRGKRKVYIVGEGIYPDLAQRVKRHLEEEFLLKGRNIDRFAFKEGSDHYAFHEAGIPAIDIFSSDYRLLGKPGDTPDTIDLEKVRRIGKVVYKAVTGMLER